MQDGCKSYNEAVSLLFQATLLCNGSWVRAESFIRQLGQENLHCNYVGLLQQWKKNLWMLVCN